MYVVTQFAESRREVRAIVRAAPVPGEISDPFIEETVDRIVQIHRGATLQLALDVGAIVVERLYGGNLEQLRERGRKLNSLRKLASHPRLPFSPATLWRCIGVYEVVRSYPESVRFEHLRLGHFTAVRKLPEAQRRTLLTQAADEKRTVTWLLRRVARERGGGRPKAEEARDVVKHVRRVENSVRACSVPSRLRAAELPAEERVAVAEHLRAVVEWCRAVEAWLGASETAALGQ